MLAIILLSTEENIPFKRIKMFKTKNNESQETNLKAHRKKRIYCEAPGSSTNTKIIELLLEGGLLNIRGT